MVFYEGEPKCPFPAGGGHLGGCGGHIEVGAEKFWINSYLYVSKWVWGSVKVSLKWGANGFLWGRAKMSKFGHFRGCGGQIEVRDLIIHVVGPNIHPREQ